MDLNCRQTQCFHDMLPSRLIHVQFNCKRYVEYSTIHKAVNNTHSGIINSNYTANVRKRKYPSNIGIRFLGQCR
jgi:hypothetical protein